MDSIKIALTKEEGSRRLFVDNMMRELTVAEWKVLLASAYNGSVTKYGVKKEYNVTYTTVDRVVKGCEKIGWLAMAGRVTSTKGTSIKSYALTQEGLLWLMNKTPRGYPFSFGLTDQENENPPRADPEDVGYVSYSSGTVHELKKAKCHDDVYAHLYEFERYVPRIARNNRSLFPIVFGGWSTLKAEAQAYFPWVIRGVAFDALLEHYKTYGGLKKKFGTLDRVLAYLMYKDYLQRATEASARFDSRFPKRILEGIEGSLNASAGLRDICAMISRELEAVAEVSFSFVKQIRLGLSRTGEPQRAD